MPGALRALPAVLSDTLDGHEPPWADRQKRITQSGRRQVPVCAHTPGAPCREKGLVEQVCCYHVRVRAVALRQGPPRVEERPFTLCRAAARGAAPHAVVGLGRVECVDPQHDKDAGTLEAPQQIGQHCKRPLSVVFAALVPLIASGSCPWAISSHTCPCLALTLKPGAANGSEGLAAHSTASGGSAGGGLGAGGGAGCGAAGGGRGVIARCQPGHSQFTSSWQYTFTGLHCAYCRAVVVPRHAARHRRRARRAPGEGVRATRAAGEESGAAGAHGEQGPDRRGIFSFTA
eukprot:6549931-Prymnesium_polylepis.2